ncbi:MAG TPA: translation initiation factor IF-2 N-terminal domain-containing protein, partial [Gemmatales bacterium]|nr:translation initiation factor IF-2 N-terminal domain-containing protein [Gemmatales bacterium]
MKDKIRIYALARELDIESRDLVDLCHRAGFDFVKSQLSSIDADQRDLIVKMLQSKATAPATPAPSPAPVAPSARPAVLPARPPTLIAPKGSVRSVPAAADADAPPVLEPAAEEVAEPEFEEAPEVAPKATAAPSAPPPLVPRPPPELAPKVRNLDQMSRRPSTMPGSPP